MCGTQKIKGIFQAFQRPDVVGDSWRLHGDCMSFCVENLLMLRTEPVKILWQTAPTKTCRDALAQQSTDPLKTWSDLKPMKRWMGNCRSMTFHDCVHTWLRSYGSKLGNSAERLALKSNSGENLCAVLACWLVKRYFHDANPLQTR